MNKKTYIPPNENTHFLVSGGGKGITAANVIALAKNYKSRFTLIGRSALLKEEPSWSLNLEQESDLNKSALTFYKEKGQPLTPKQLKSEVKQVLSSREINQTLTAIEDAGGTGQYLELDITDGSALEKNLKPHLPEINGILHGAGVLADKYIDEKTEADFDLVYGVKIGGLKNLLTLISPEQLDYLILFSSVAGYYGNPGQADYSLSNEIMNKLSHYLKGLHPDCQILSIGWGPWDGGMVTPQLKRILTRKNVPLIPVNAGTQTLIELLNNPQDNPHRVVGNPMPFPDRPAHSEKMTYKISRKLKLEENPFLADHVIGGKAVLPTVCAVSWIVSSCEQLNPGYSFFAVRDYQVFKGIVFEGDSPEDYLLEINEGEKRVDALVFDGKISSQMPDGKSRYHYQAQVEFRKTIPDMPKLPDFNLKMDSSVTGKSLYDSKVLFHGPRFQGVQEVLNVNPQGITLRCNLSPILVEELGQFPISSFNPFLADVHLQSLLIWANSQRQSIGLPLRINEAVQYQAVPFGTTTYATMKVTTSTPHKLVADVTSHDKDGNIFSEVRGAEITLSENLLDLFQDNQLEIEPVWI
ncbi:MAG: polyketide synthase dehydratase domain-containing protein [Chloroflexi bacterium]|nr:polyketide synthase dehydratase domain-containing protein [Chloroflexota bacterium]